MASGTIAMRPRPFNITNSLHYQLPDGQGNAAAFYDPITKMVSGFMSVRNASVFNQQTAIFSIDEPYRPYTNYGMPMMIFYNDGTNAGVQSYQGVFRMDGDVRQSLTSSATGIYCAFQYPTLKY